jgi:Kelch motif
MKRLDAIGRFLSVVSTAAVVSLVALVAPAAADQFSGVQSMAVARFSFTATTLLNGDVLVAGGSAFDRRAELYDPASSSFAPTSGLMTTGRIGQTATRLANGKVLIAGGEDASFSATASAELYDPSSGTFSATGSMTVPRAFHTATLLPNGKVLIVGGWQFNFPSSALASAELYDPISGTFSPTGSMSTGRVDQTATLLGNGEVLVVGGFGNLQLGLASAELYDPSAGTFSPTGSMVEGRGNQTATLLGNGKVLVAGGYTGFPGAGLSSAELYDPSTGAFTSTGSMAAQRGDHTATLLSSGKVLIAGGFTNFPCAPALASAELYNPDSGTFTATASMTTPRGRHAAALLPNGDVLVAGGLGDFCSGPLASAEVYLQQTPFSSFNVNLSITSGKGTKPDTFDLSGTFALGAGDNGINPLSEDVAFAIGPIQATIPAGSFVADGHGGYHFTGTVGGISLDIYIAPKPGGGFRIAADGSGDLNGITNPVTIRLVIGDDVGMTTVTAEFH